MPRKKKPSVEAIIPPIECPDLDDGAALPSWDIEKFQRLLDALTYIYNSVQDTCRGEPLCDCPHCSAESLLDQINEEVQLSAEEVAAIGSLLDEEDPDEVH